MPRAAWASRSSTLAHPRLRREHHPGFLPQRRIVDVHVRHLVVPPRRTPGSPRRRAPRRPVRARTAIQPRVRKSRLRCTGRSTAVIPYSESTATSTPRASKKSIRSPAHLVDPAKIGGQGRIVRTEPLQVVVQVRQVDEVQAGTMPFLDPARHGGDPARGTQARARPPERLEGERSQVPLQFRAREAGWLYTPKTLLPSAR